MSEFEKLLNGTRKGKFQLIVKLILKHMFFFVASWLKFHQDLKILLIKTIVNVFLDKRFSTARNQRSETNEQKNVKR